MFKTSIYDKVMKEVKARITSGQKRYDDYCKEADKNMNDTIVNLKNETQSMKNNFADKLVSEILK